jgi:hypothetical protein
MVEALIVIASFIMFDLGLVFFRELYLKKIHSGTVARADALAFSMRGCAQDGSATDRDPASWARQDLNPNTNSSNPPPSSGTQAFKQTPATSNSAATNIMGTLPGGSPNGVLNPIVDFGLSVNAASTTKTGLLSARKGFKKTVTSTSHVNCTDVVKNDQFSEVFSKIRSFLPIK